MLLIDASRQSRVMHTQTSPNLWLAPSQMEWRFQATRRRLRRRALFFQLGALGPPGLNINDTFNTQDHAATGKAKDVGFRGEKRDDWGWTEQMLTISGVNGRPAR